MTRPGKRNLITDVAGISVGQSEDAAARTGVTVVVTERPFAAAVDVRGGAPGTSETEALDPINLVGAVDAIVLSGGSVYGLDAAAGVVAWLGARGRGFRLRADAPPAPIVPGAILFDLANGGDKQWGTDPPYRVLAVTAAERAADAFALGNAGAGLGATAGMYKGGTGSASVITERGFTIGALAIVNSAGSPLIPYTDVFWAFPFERNSEFGAKRLPPDFRYIDSALPPDMKRPPQAGANTTLAIVATDAELSRLELKRLAIMAADGVARAVRPIHTPFDGDIVFALATGSSALTGPRPFALIELGNAAADCLARAIARGVFEADSLGTMRSYRDLCAKGEDPQ
ncbi:MAG TPA: P1 family peptidase [Rhizomicrobium sp.]|jgi:L-aminopeptidase/D-esterase-like protein|nr:P1 family peptidase [Rhizomicrobium sp.]